MVVASVAAAAAPDDLLTNSLSAAGEAEKKGQKVEDDLLWLGGACLRGKPQRHMEYGQQKKKGFRLRLIVVLHACPPEHQKKFQLVVNETLCFVSPP